MAAMRQIVQAAAQYGVHCTAVHVRPPLYVIRRNATGTALLWEVFV